ncbi:DnaJ-domain-containing protein [Epithele typhae]|uniref:DnaJ-domain-containing protein n=1 Tax=Epithele typhae TaxID=378194 RepID=UPI002007A6D0|nr:DnaJ-domain-containing protein [Epithele typhae]KAH9929591.1 DnaJ-domain-containing protein [Epithele typhae]
MDALEHAPDVAAVLLTQAIDIDSTNPIYYLGRAIALMKDAQYLAALRDFDCASSKESYENTVPVCLQTARCRLLLGSPATALIAAEEALFIDPLDERAKELKTRIQDIEAQQIVYKTSISRNLWHMARGAYETCLEIYAKEDSDAPTEIRCWGIELLVVERQWDSATKAAEMLLRDEPCSVEVMILRALVLFLQAKMEEAVAQLGTALDLDSDNPTAKVLCNRVKSTLSLKVAGTDAFLGGRWLEAIESWTRALEHVGEGEREGRGGLVRSTLLFNRAVAYLKTHDFSSGLKDVNESLELRPAYFKALLCRARIHVGLELYESAIQDFEVSLDLGKTAMSPADKITVKTELLAAAQAKEREVVQDHYTTLGLREDCSHQEIRRAYRTLSLKHHPDKGGSEEKFKLIANAYSILSNSSERNMYDVQRRWSRSPQASSFAGDYYHYAA